MRSALLCVFFTLIILRRIHAQQDEFRPMPIPLSDWQYYRREGRAGNFHETIKTESPPIAAAIPAHYWEDALRHSVYLTLVRDKIDQLIAKGEVISPHSKHGNYDSKEIDDHDLWDKVKTAPFDRIKQDDPDGFGDITIMAKGRLLENDRGYHFVEDERTKDKCGEDDCMRDVKAFWSVKRVRQRDMETSPGKYHYELTFSVISQKPKKQTKPYENPIRTFTVKESSPNGVLDKPQEYRKFGHGPQTSRPERAIWVHKNISPTKQTGRKHYFHGLDRIFSSFFSDDEEKAFDPSPQKYKQGPFVTPVPPLYPKIGHVGPNEQYQQMPYPYRPHPGKHVRPPLQAPPTYPLQHQYLDGIITASNPHAPYSHDHRVESSQTIKTTRPAVLPTPLPQKGYSGEVTNMMSIESTDDTSLPPETTVVHKTYNKYKTTPAKQNYFSDHVRPPIYNAPPGVFVTMDKKPFKPMPPLKLMHSKPHRPNRPIDFRPSPQITDVQNTDTFADSAFRPITMNFGDSSAPEKLEILDTPKKGEANKNRKPTATGKKPPKKHEKPQRTTTATPDIITAQSTSEEEIETLDWANILGAFTKTTPMLSQTEKMHITEATTTPSTTTTTVTTARPRSTTTTAAPEKTTISTTAKPKRTRPPPKYAKQDKIKKHKRITTTTTTTTTTTSTTTEVPENQNKKRLSHDLTPQASSAATGLPKPTTSHREPQNKTQTTTPSTTTTTTTSTKPTTSKTTTTTQSPSTTKSTLSTTQPRNKSRFRQSTLMYKGTSIKHDKWNGVQSNQTVTTTPNAPHNHRRKGSNFHGYVSSTPRQIIEERERNHADYKPSPSTESVTEIKTTQTNYEEPLEQYETNSVIPLDHTDKEAEEDYEDDSKDQSEFIFQPTTTQSTLQVVSTSYTPAGNKTKCKKKKTNISTTEQPIDFSAETFGTTPKSYTVATTRSPTESPTTSDILEEFLNFNFNDDEEKGSSNARGDLQKEESMNHESYLKIDDFEEFLDMHLSDKKHSSDDDQYGNDDEDDENEDDDVEEYENSKIPSIDDDTEFPSEEEKHETGRHSNTENTEEKRPYTLFELMAMS
ncbi:mucin-2-like [Bicyclus anynana]|uniref:Mucin-2-like n=1 Tax=Bicyclus anynana TaxID=110368 RepID=A0ABM3LUA3_BICAN|nr:mucin-2-like [Bicyclus anynana]